ncbi:hypothetical protein BDZ91DRAFT_333660 [Kalaharituber pfeilii]|nr:hypothetical protein BDZ91DRAFT_333660 [Kalaharituber pfeilii]
MPVIENLKNFIRHGKQAKNIQNNEVSSTNRNRHVHSDPAPGTGDVPLHKAAPPADFFVAAGGGNRNIVAQADVHIANATAQHQHLEDDPGIVPGAGPGIGITPGGIVGGINAAGKYDDTLLARIVAEEKESKGKLPKYPGLERYTLLEKMGDGAFSNVYRAKDKQGDYEEVAIKVVRKYELNAHQVCFFQPQSMSRFCS